MFPHKGKSGANGASGGRTAGQALIEFALIAPILILLLAALVQFGVIFERQIGISNAVREAARRGAAFATPNGPTAQANATWTKDQLVLLLTNSQTHDSSRDTYEVCIVTPAAHPTDASGATQVVVRITESYRHPLFLPIVDLILDNIDGVQDSSLAASTSAEFHVEQPASPPPNVGTGGVERTGGSVTPCTP